MRSGPIDTKLKKKKRKKERKKERKKAIYKLFPLYLVGLCRVIAAASDTKNAGLSNISKRECTQWWCAILLPSAIRSPSGHICRISRLGRTAWPS